MYQGQTGWIGDRQDCLSPNGFQQVAIDAAVGLTIPVDTRMCVVCPTVQNARFRSDGTNPTAAVGVRIAVGELFVIDSLSIMTAIRFISETAGSLLNVEYYK